MVTRVWGTADDFDLEFSLSPSTGLWEAQVPADADGQYVVQLWAQDAAGNTAYYATVLVSIDLSCLCVSIRVIEYGADFEAATVGVEASPDHVSLTVQAESVRLSASVVPVCLTVKQCEVIGCNR